MPDKTIPIPTVGNADEGSQREHLAAYFITAAPYEEQTTAQRIEYCQKLRELGELENREVLQAAGSSRVLVWGNPASHLQHLLTATQYLAAGLGYPLLLFPAKDTIINAEKTSKNGVLDAKHYSDEDNRSWIFRSVGYGSETKKWKDIMSELVLAGYTDAVCIEHEDSLMAPEEGLEKAVALLKEVIIRKAKPVGMRWA